MSIRDPLLLREITILDFLPKNELLPEYFSISERLSLKPLNLLSIDFLGTT